MARRSAEVTVYCGNEKNRRPDPLRPAGSLSGTRRPGCGRPDQNRGLRTLQGDGDFAQLDGRSRSAAHRLAGVRRCGAMGHGRVEWIWPRKGAPGKVGTIRAGVDAGTVVPGIVGAALPAAHRGAAGLEFLHQRSSDRRTGAGASARIVPRRS